MLRRVLAVLFLVAAGLVVAPPGPAWACSCGAPQYTGDLVVVGVAESVQKPWTSEEVRVRIRVESVERGSAGSQVEVRTPDQGPACGYEFVAGHRYRVYVNDGNTSSCDGNADLGLVDRPAEGPPAALWWSLGSGAVLVGALVLLRWRRKAA
jgi:hypothetical protein